MVTTVTRKGSGNGTGADSQAARNQQLLAAGALLPRSALLLEKNHADLVDARAYRHPALGERQVVRLTPAALAEGEAVVLEFLGFDVKKVTVHENVAQRRRQALGFPAWALVHDPKKARFALEVMKDFRREARRAKSKPGFAKEGIDAIAKKLARSVPHFLPSFYEEAGRVFIDSGNQTYAAQCFGKAREAEQVHGLEIDEEARKAAFLEFALAGAVTIKALSAYAKDLEQAHGPAEAYKHFREIAVRRTLGGLPPWAGMAKDMQRLAKGAKLDTDAEDEKLIEELLPASSLNRAPSGFWDTYKEALARVVARNLQARDQLLQLSPNPGGGRSEEQEFFDAWLKLLEEVGAVRGWLDAGPEVRPEEPRGKATAWLARMLKLGAEERWPSAAPDSMFALVRRMANYLKADGTPVRPYLEREWDSSVELDVDFCDLCLELGLAVADPGGQVQIDFDDWARAAKNSKERPRDPLHVARDARFAEVFQKAVGEACGDSDFESAAKGKQSLFKARRQWLLDLCEPKLGALPALDDNLQRVESSTTVHTFEEFPEALPKLQAMADDIEGRLLRSIRGGLAAELCWPALEAACKALDPDSEGRLKFGGSFPFCVVTDEKKAIVVGPAGKVFEHDLRIPKGSHGLNWLQFVDGQLLVVFRDKSYDNKAYWSDSPKKVFEPDLQGWPSVEPEGWQIALPGGGVHLGGGPLRPGDSKIPNVETNVLCDGKTFWRRASHDGKQKLEEFEPLRGEKGRVSLPAFLESFVRDGYSLDDDCSLIPAPEGLRSSPLGMKDGLLGWRARRPEVGDDEDESKAYAKNEAESIDGRRFVGDLGGERHPDALLSLPGDPSRHRPLDAHGYINEEMDEYTVAVWDAEGKQLVARWGKNSPYSGGVPVVLPIYWWHVYQPRDEKSSAALRGISQLACRELLQAAEQDLAEQEKTKDKIDDDDEKKKKSEAKKAEAAVKKVLPEIGDKVLRHAVAGVALEAARIRAKQQELSRMRDPKNPEATLVAEESGEAWADLDDLLGLVLEESGSLDGSLAQIRGVSSFFANGTALKIPEANCGWAELSGRVGSLLYLAAAPGCKPENREAALRFLSAWMETPFLVPENGRLRTYTCELKRKKLPFAVQNDGYYAAWGMGEHSGNHYFLTQLDIDDDDQSGVKVLEHAPDGKFKLLPSAKIDGDETPLEPGWATAEKLRRFIEAVQTKGSWSYERAMGEALANRTGMSYAEAALITAGFPYFDTWKTNFLPTELREQLGLKVKEADTARDALRRIGSKKLRDILDGALPDEPDHLYQPLGSGPDDEQSFIARLAESYTSVMGKRIPLDPDLVAQMGKDLNFLWVKPPEVIDLLSNPKKAPQLNKDASWMVGDYGVEREGSGESEAFEKEILERVAVYLLYLSSELPVGHALHKQLPEVHARVVKRLSSPKLLLDAATVFPGNKKKAMAFVASVGGKSYKPPKSARKADSLGRDNGVLIALPDEDEGNCVYVAFRPAKVKDWSTLHKLAGEDDEGGLALAAAEAMLSPGVKEILERLQESGVPEGSYEANPLLSVPTTVKDVQKKLKLSEDAAVYYLQLLALAAPTQARVQLWNGWTPARIKKAGEELKKAKLVIEAKRSRAGRSHFLPGGWEALSAPNLPVETWKLPLYGITRARKGEKLHIPFQRILPTRPLHVLFAEAWKRIQKGDKPEYEKVK